MLRWNAQWRLDLDIANVTSAFSAINVAGPLSRQVIESVGCSVDLSAEHFPYLAYQEASVAGIPARMMRVGLLVNSATNYMCPRLDGRTLGSAA